MSDIDLRNLFVQERQYVKNVSPKTVIWYRTAFSVFNDCGLDNPAGKPPKGLLAALKSRVMDLQSAGQHKPISLNSWIRVVNAYLRWLHTEEYLPVLLKLPRLKEPETIIRPWTTEHVHALIHARPTVYWRRRAQTLALFIADTGLRISEALSLDRDDIDMDNMLVTVRQGKGRKARIVPISVMGRKLMARHLSSHNHKPVFSTRAGTRLTQRNSLRAFKLLCAELGIEGVRTSWHTLRHSFAAAFVREGGDVFSLQRMLGHSTLAMTQRYVRLSTEDMQAKHAQHARLLAGVR